MIHKVHVWWIRQGTCTGFAVDINNFIWHNFPLTVYFPQTSASILIKNIQCRMYSYELVVLCHRVISTEKSHFDAHAGFVELTPGLAVHVYFYHKLHIHLYIKPKIGTRAVLRPLSNSDWPQNKTGRHADQVSSWAYFEAELKASHFLSTVDTPKKARKAQIIWRCTDDSTVIGLKHTKCWLYDFMNC